MTSGGRATGPIRCLPVSGGAGSTAIDAVEGKTLRVIGLRIHVDGDGTMELASDGSLSDDTATDIIPPMQCGTSVPWDFKPTLEGWGNSVQGEGLTITSSAANWSGVLILQEVN
ncbi:MAG TPA: hypothetical protein VG713_13040 [Pirellulales bacterium]|nr:hypothetical protein [Pirellulales bacterium]